ncbi:hypothetical protein Syn7502_02994 [Synechococcus sp. PCC 7502]|nr:hypothetical protein [Synechococcus sp. PCC 7502]AFY74905.1 hypothetical protein Syn7502_02994 [Synechococcus sp. PCC 7502]
MLTVTDPITQKLNFDKFIKQCSDEGRYELVNGEIIEVRSGLND